jgi:hypothetical protein
MTALPPHKLSETNNTRRIDIFSWSLEAITAPIINASESDTLQAKLGIPLPEMTFGNNSFELTHNPSGWKYRFDAENALKYVKRGELQPGDGGVKVGYADAWLKSRSVKVNMNRFVYSLTGLWEGLTLTRRYHLQKPYRQSHMTGRTPQRIQVTLSMKNAHLYPLIPTIPSTSYLLQN